MSFMSLTDFEQRYRANPDPWAYRTSAYEAAKYNATVKACGDGPFQRALELGGSIGVFTELLAPRCRSLITLDGAPTAVRDAQARLAACAHIVDVRLGVIPESIPAGPFDLVVASEILYYLTEEALSATLARLEQVLGDSGRLVCVHWRPAGAERPFDAAAVHQRVLSEPWLRHVDSASTGQYLLDVLERR